MKIQKMSREQAESNLTFLGFIIFENKLKDTTPPVIHELRRAGIRNIMCTGDNILTAISVARDCGLIDQDSPCFVPRFVDSKFEIIPWRHVLTVLGNHHFDANASLVWENVDNPAVQLDEFTLKVGELPPGKGLTLTNEKQPRFDSVYNDISVPFDNFNMRTYSLAVSGDVFRWLINYGDQQVLKKVGDQFI